MKIEEVQRAAERGEPKAQSDLGDMYEKGWGGIIPADLLKSAEWWEKAAIQGHAPAQYNLARIFNGLGGVITPKDDAMAIQWYQKSAEQGYIKAQESLGRHYEEGWGVPVDFKKAKEWYMKASAQGSDFATKQLSHIDISEKYSHNSQTITPGGPSEFIARGPTANGCLALPLQLIVSLPIGIFIHTFTTCLIVAAITGAIVNGFITSIWYFGLQASIRMLPNEGEELKIRGLLPTYFGVVSSFAFSGAIVCAIISAIANRILTLII